MSWYYAWGGATDTSAGWSWRIGSSHNHFGYQNPLAAWALSNVRRRCKPQSPTAQRRLGQAASTGSSSSTAGCSPPRAPSPVARPTAGTARTPQPPAGTPTFYGMVYDEHPVYHDPPSQPVVRLPGLVACSGSPSTTTSTGDAQAKALLDKWVPWAIANTTIGTGGDFQIPSDTGVERRAGHLEPDQPGGQHRTCTSRSPTQGQDVGVAAATPGR